MKPSSLKMRMYQVGFGDAFLLTFTYPGERKHVLIDCGSNAASNFAMDEIAQAIVDECKKEPIAIVASHRHKDHISGFGGDAWEKLKKLNVRRVIQPWTEDPDLASDATAPAMTPAATVATLSSLQDLVEHIDGLMKEHPDYERLHGLAANNYKNPELVHNLQTWKAKTDYVQFGDIVLESFLPGVKVRVLGPPTREEMPKFSYAKDSDEYWHLVGGRPLGAVGGQVDKRGPRFDLSTDPPIHAKWMRSRLDAFRERRWLEIVTAVDSALNNTSVILLFEVADQFLLFPGDAQLESWRYALAQDGVEQLLAKVTWYKVGHHGSHNATPKTMWAALALRNNGLSTLLSTHDHGSYPDVPQESLVDALDAESTLYSTHRKGEDAMVVETEEIDLTSS